MTDAAASRPGAIPARRILVAEFLGRDRLRSPWCSHRRSVDERARTGRRRCRQNSALVGDTWRLSMGVTSLPEAFPRRGSS